LPRRLALASGRLSACGRPHRVSNRSTARVALRSESLDEERAWPPVTKPRSSDVAAVLESAVAELEQVIIGVDLRARLCRATTLCVPARASTFVSSPKYCDELLLDRA